MIGPAATPRSSANRRQSGRSDGHPDRKPDEHHRPGEHHALPGHDPPQLRRSQPDGAQHGEVAHLTPLADGERVGEDDRPHRAGEEETDQREIADTVEVHHLGRNRIGDDLLGDVPIDRGAVRTDDRRR